MKKILITVQDDDDAKSIIEMVSQFAGTTAEVKEDYVATGEFRNTAFETIRANFKKIG